MSREGVEKLLQERRVSFRRRSTASALRARRGRPITALLSFRAAAPAQRFLKPKYARQKNKKEAVYNGAKRTRVALVEKLLLDPQIQPF